MATQRRFLQEGKVEYEETKMGYLGVYGLYAASGGGIFYDSRGNSLRRRNLYHHFLFHFDLYVNCNNWNRSHYLLASETGCHEGRTAAGEKS